MGYITCFVCPNIANDQHEIFFSGNTHLRNRQIEYGIRIPLCKKHHGEAHGKFESFQDYIPDYKEFYQRIFCEKLNVNYYFLKALVSKKRLTNEDKEFLKMLGNKLC